MCLKIGELYDDEVRNVHAQGFGHDIVFRTR